MATCLNHPHRLATARCKRCSKPICDDCKMVSEVGVVCSQECLDAVKTFHERIKDDLPHPARRPLLARKPIRALLAVLILLGIAYGVLCYRAGRILGPSEILDQLGEWVGLLGSLF
jgi:hypothetical protein